MDTSRELTQAERFAARRAAIVARHGQAELDRLTGAASREAAFKAATVARLLREQRGQS